MKYSAANAAEYFIVSNYSGTLASNELMTIMEVLKRRRYNSEKQPCFGN